MFVVISVNLYLTRGHYISVTNISRTISVENHLYIDDVKSSMQHISLVHIEALIDEMVRFIDEDGNEQLSGKELERKLSGRILEVLHGI